MDISETYIKMCEKAEEIQNQKPDGSQGEFVFCEGEVYQEMDDCPLTPFIWLPRQDQLQEMVSFRGFIDWEHWLGHIYGWNYGNKPNGHLHIFETWEQLWLAFVMKEKYNKVWNEGDWETNSR